LVGVEGVPVAPFVDDCPDVSEGLFGCHRVPTKASTA
jgi:hypothetical protein